MNYLLSAEDSYRGRGYDRGQEAEQKQVKNMKDRRDKVQAEYHVLELQQEGPQYQCLKHVASRDKVVNMETGDSDDALTLKDVMNIPGLKRRLISVGQLDEEGYHHQRLSDMSRIGMNMLASKGNIPDVRKVDIYFCKTGGLGKQNKLFFTLSEKIRKLQRCCGRYNANLQVKCLKFDNGGEYRLHIPEEEWRGKDTSLVHLKVFGCDSFVKVKDVCEEAMKCTFIGSGSDEMRYSFQDTKSHQKSQVVLVDIPDKRAENDSIVSDGLSLEITQSPGGSSDTSERSKNSKRIEDSGRLDEEYSKDRASCKEGGSKTLHIENDKPKSYSEALSSKVSVQLKKAIIEEMVLLEKNQTCSLVRLPAGKKASQSLWMFRVKEEQDVSKRLRHDRIQQAQVVVALSVRDEG
uniref:Retrovirus-related Pol polyprotein from transposon TNT 1-94 n=1 Tax=Tanacetum cinerariifolium TaxID=118510 RepID=A0A6L2L2U2_TANCI|nr:hypothetical protein [Tanacetum cinerariifolium]